MGERLPSLRTPPAAPSSLLGRAVRSMALGTVLAIGAVTGVQCAQSYRPRTESVEDWPTPFDELGEDEPLLGKHIQLTVTLEGAEGKTIDVQTVPQEDGDILVRLNGRTYGVKPKEDGTNVTSGVKRMHRKGRTFVFSGDQFVLTVPADQFANDAYAFHEEQKNQKQEPDEAEITLSGTLGWPNPPMVHLSGPQPITLQRRWDIDRPQIVVASNR